MTGRKVLVWVPGINGRASITDAFVRKVRYALGNEWTVHVFRHGLWTLSVRSLDSVSAELAAQIRVWCDDLHGSEGVDQVVLAGHSLGGLLVRAAYLRDLGTIDDDPAIRGEKRPWTAKVARIALFGSPNSGFRKDAMRLSWRIAYALATPWRDYAIEQVESGAYWLSTLRLRWVDAMRRPGLARPTIVQVLGTRDDLVSEEDMLDARYLTDTVRIDMPGADHGGLVRNLDPVRMSLVMAALRGTPDERSEPPKAPAPGATYFILHGIRASAYNDWVPRLKDALLAADPEADVVSPDYGFFSAIDFALPWIRNRKTHSFLRWYAEMYVSRNPEEFRFAGHSNGTYLMANALLRVPAMRFRRIFLAGTVLPRAFAWRDLADRRQIGHYAGADREWVQGSVHNDRARVDVPVGFLCSWLHGLGMGDIGTGGLDGFVEAPTDLIREHKTVFRGGHGGAFTGQGEDDVTAAGQVSDDEARRLRDAGQQHRLEEIAALLKDDTEDAPPPYLPSSGYRTFSRFVGNRIVAWVMFLLLVAIVGAVAALIGLWAGAVGWGVLAGVLIVLLAVVFLRAF